MKYEHVMIDSSAKIADDVVIGPFTVIGENVEIDSGTVIDSHAVIHKNTKIGKNNRIYSYANIGDDPQHLSHKGGETFLEVGDHNTFREFTSVHRGTLDDQGLTKIGDHNYFMSYSHIGHDCMIGNHVLFINNATVAGHVVIENHAVLGAFTAVHQFCRIGEYSFTTRGAMVSKDVLPYTIVVGSQPTVKGINSVALKRGDVSDASIKSIRDAYTVIYKHQYTPEEIQDKLSELSSESAEVLAMMKAFTESARGVVR